MLHLPVYLDYNSTTPCDPRVLEAMLPFFTRHFGNAASRTHSFGWEAEAAVENARQQIADLIGSESKEIIFTSGATEACNLAIKGVYEAYSKKGNHIISVQTEHNAVLDSLTHLQKLGASITLLPVNAEGLIDLVKLEAAIRPDTILIAVMHANNETGTIQPIKKISALARKHEVLFFTDATQAVGKIPVNVNSDGIDLMAMSAHKLYGPKGIGALFIRRRDPRVTIIAQMDGGGHERGMRSGTLNVPAIVGFGKACSVSAAEMAVEAGQLLQLRNILENKLLQIPGSSLNGSQEFRLHNTLNIAFSQVDNEGVFASIGKKIALSSGSACSSATMEPSHVLLAMGLPRELARGSIRIGVGRFTTEEEVTFAVEIIINAVEAQRGIEQTSILNKKI